MHNFENFKGFAKAELELSKPFTILIGPNGAGKSNVIEAIELLSFIAYGGPLHEITDLGRGNYGLQIRGSLSACPRFAQKAFSLHFSDEFKNKPFSYSVAVQTEPIPLISQEKLVYEGRILFETISKNKEISTDIWVRYENFAQGKKPLVSVSANQSVLSQYQDFATKNKEREKGLKLIKAIKISLRAPFVFEPNPKLMRQYERVGNRVLAKDGANLSAVLYALDQNNSEQHILHRLLDWIKPLSDQSYQAFDFDLTKYHNVMFGLKEGHNKHSVSANLLSDGTLRHLAMLTALETVDASSLMVIEEFDNGLHASRIERLVKAIEEVCQRRNLKILVTTHNPATLNFLERSIEQLDGLVLCTWDDAKQASKLTRLFDLPRFEAFLEKGQLGDLVTHRQYERYLVPHFEEQRKKEVLAWLENLP
jgi:predicted ATPase